MREMQTHAGNGDVCRGTTTDTSRPLCRRQTSIYTIALHGRATHRAAIYRTETDAAPLGKTRPTTAPVTPSAVNWV
jgi:hypothetical protein